VTPEERYQRVKDIFLMARDRGVEERLEFLSEACGGEAALREEVEALLARHLELETLGQVSGEESDSNGNAPGLTTADTPYLGGLLGLYEGQDEIAGYRLIRQKAQSREYLATARNLRREYRERKARLGSLEESWRETVARQAVRGAGPRGVDGGTDDRQHPGAVQVAARGVLDGSDGLFFPRRESKRPAAISVDHGEWVAPRGRAC
jgi:hypothetical protein